MSNDRYDYNNNQDHGHSAPGGFQDSPGPGPYTPPPGRAGNGGRSGSLEAVSWVIDVGLIFVVFPLGLTLTILHACGVDVVGSVLKGMRSGGSDARSKTRSAPYTEAERRAAAYRPVTEQPGTTAAPEKPAQKKTPGRRRADAGAKVLSVFGWILVAFGAMALLGTVSGSSLWSLLTAGAVTLGGGAMLFASRAGRKKEAKFKSCLNVTGVSGVVNMDHVARTLGLDLAQTDKLLGEMVERGYYGPRAYLDHQRKLLVIDPQDMRDVYRAEDEAKTTKAEAQAKANATQYERILTQIAQADDDIEDEAMSEKIRRMRSITAAIFKEVESHPEKKPAIRRFMDYYLPTTLKLLDSYARIEAQGVTGDNMAKAKADIERIADTLVAGYEKQLDTLYQAEAVDIAGDVSVIENMMRRDGLTGGNDFKTARQPQQSPFGQTPGQVQGGH